MGMPGGPTCVRGWPSQNAGSMTATMPAARRIVSRVALDQTFVGLTFSLFVRDNLRQRRAIVGDALNLLELSDGWGHLRFGTNWDGNQHAYETTIDLRKA